jgi:CDP-glucose 4,6-dehydratase
MGNYWQGKNVFITGINGFIGGNLAKKLNSIGANVFGLLRNKKHDTLLYFENIATKVTLIEGDLTDRDLITRIISEEEINAVFHLAAQVEIGIGIKNPYLTFETNTRGTYSLMEAIRLFPDTIRSVVVASTDKSYGSYGKEKMPYKEDYPLIPIYPYDVSKACADMIARSYASDVYRLPIVVTRFCNIYGPGQLNFSAIIPDAIRSALGFTTLIPRGDGKQIRDFIFVDDVVELYLLISESLSKDPQKYAGEIYNAGTNSPKSIKEVVEDTYNFVGNTKDLEKVIRLMAGKETTGEIACQYMDFEKVNKSFGWKPSHEFKDGIEKTIEWFKKYLTATSE